MTKQNQPPLVNFAYNTSVGNGKFSVSDASRLSFPDFLRAQNMVREIGSKII